MDLVQEKSAPIKSVIIFMVAYQSIKNNHVNCYLLKQSQLVLENVIFKEINPSQVNGEESM